MNWFKICKQYDKIKEPYRMWIFFYFMLPFILGLLLYNNDKTKFAGAIGLLFGCGIGIYRILYFIYEGA